MSSISPAVRRQRLVGMSPLSATGEGQRLHAGAGAFAGILAERVVSVFAAERERWLLWVPVFFGGGIAVYFALAEEPPLWSGSMALAVLACGCLLCRQRTGILLVLLAATALAAGFTLTQWRSHVLAAPVLIRDMGPVMLEGRVIAVETRDYGYRITMAPSHGLGRKDVRLERVRIVVRGQAHPRPGDTVRVRAMLMPPSEPQVPGGFDFARMAWFQQLGAVGYAVGTVATTAPARGMGARATIERLRLAISAQVRTSVPGAPGAVAAALLTGARGAIPDTTLRDMRDSGLAHLLAISGLHVGLVAGCLFLLVRLALAAMTSIALNYPVRKIAAVVSLAGALGYLLLTGMTVPTQRAFIMVAFAVLAVLLNRTAISMRVLAWTAMIVLILSPESLLSPSFQMSFAAVLGLIAVYEFASPHLADWRRQGGVGRRFAVYFLAVALTTLIAGLATGPFAAFHFHRLANYGLLANLLCVPLMATVIMPSGVIALLLMPLGLHDLALVPMALGIEATLEVARSVAELPAATYMVPSFPTLLLGALSLCGIWLCLWRRPWRMAGAVAAAALLAFAAFMPREGATEIVVDATGERFALRTPSGKVALSPGMREGRTSETWLTHWGLDAGIRKPTDSALLTCDELGCVHAANGFKVSFSGSLGALVDDCRISAIVIAQIPTRWHCRQPRLTIDRFDLAREGSHLIRLGKRGTEISTVAQQQGARPWSRSWQRRNYRGERFSTYGRAR